MVARSIGLHVFLLVGAAVLALRAWTTEDQPHEKHVAAELWSARQNALERIEFETPKHKLSIEPKQDAAGRYYVGRLAPVEPTSEPQAAADAGAQPVHAKPPKPEEPQAFVSVEKAESLAKSLATLRASRVLGKVPDDRLAEFGFDESDKGTLTVFVAGSKHVLALGEKTPGGRDRYARNPETGEGYVIEGGVANDLISAKNRLVERAFHDFGEETVGKVVLTAGDKTREVVRHATEKNFWASPDSPETKDETVSNWMTKVERLRVTAYLETPDPPISDQDLVVRVDYVNDKGKPLGFLEIVRQPAEKEGDRPRYAARSERSRWYATVLRSTAEQIDQDLGSVLEP